MYWIPSTSLASIQLSTWRGLSRQMEANSAHNTKARRQCPLTQSCSFEARSCKVREGLGPPHCRLVKVLESSVARHTTIENVMQKKTFKNNWFYSYKLSVKLWKAKDRFKVAVQFWRNKMQKLTKILNLDELKTTKDGAEGRWGSRQTCSVQGPFQVNYASAKTAELEWCDPLSWSSWGLELQLSDGLLTGLWTHRSSSQVY